MNILLSEELWKVQLHKTHKNPTSVVCSVSMPDRRLSLLLLLLVLWRMVINVHTPGRQYMDVIIYVFMETCLVKIENSMLWISLSYFIRSGFCCLL